MSEQDKNEVQKESPKPREFRGLYRNVKISVKTLDKIIAVGIIAIFVVIFIGLQSRGYTIEFDSNGGTDIPPQRHMYGELVEEPEDPTRDGYIFDGWYFEEAFYERYDFENETVYNDLTLYAKWIEAN